MNSANRSARSARKTSFAGDVLKLVSGTAFSQILLIIASPLLTRLYEPKAFGTLAIFLSITNIIGVVICLRYDQSIMLPKRDEDAASLLGASLGFVILISLLTIPLIWFGQPVILNLLNAPELRSYLWLIPPMLFFNGVGLALNYWNSRTKHFGRLSVARIFQSVTTVGTQLGTGYAGYATGGSLIAAGVLGSALSSSALGGQIWRDDSHFLRRSISWDGIMAGLKRYSNYPLYDTWASLLNTISAELPALLLSTFFSASVVGYYALAVRLMSLPMSLIGRSIGQVFFQRASVARNEGKLANVTEKTFSYLVKLSIFPILMLTLISKGVIVFVFGQEWQESGVYLQIIGLWAVFWFISSPLSSLFDVLQKQKNYLYIQIGIFLSRLISLTVGGYLNNSRLALALFSASGVLAYGYLTVYITHSSGVNLGVILNKLFLEILRFIPFGILIIAMQLLTVNSLFVVVSSILMVMMYLYLTFRHNVSWFINKT
jgi:lipopolysaccharide exporter